MTLLDLIGLAAGQQSGPIRSNGTVIGRIEKLGARTAFRDRQDRLLGSIVQGSDGRSVVYDAIGRTVARLGQ